MADMNDRLDRFKSSVNRGVATISVKANTTIEKTKIKTHIETLNSEIKKLISEAGEKSYEIWSAGGKDYASLEEVFLMIQAKKAEIDSLNNEIKALPEKENRILGHNEVRPPEQKEEAAKPQPVFCTKCGAKYFDKVNFCVKCGARME